MWASIFSLLERRRSSKAENKGHAHIVTIRFIECQIKIDALNSCVAKAINKT